MRYGHARYDELFEFDLLPFLSKLALDCTNYRARSMDLRWSCKDITDDARLRSEGSPLERAAT